MTSAMIARRVFDDDVDCTCPLPAATYDAHVWHNSRREESLIAFRPEDIFLWMRHNQTGNGRIIKEKSAAKDSSAICESTTIGCHKFHSAAFSVESWPPFWTKPPLERKNSGAK